MCTAWNFLGEERKGRALMYSMKPVARRNCLYVPEIKSSVFD